MNVPGVDQTLQAKIVSATTSFPWSLLVLTSPNSQKGIAVCIVLGFCLIATCVVTQLYGMFDDGASWMSRIGGLLAPANSSHKSVSHLGPEWEQLPYRNGHSEEILSRPSKR
jgi:hypothetical protein